MTGSWGWQSQETKPGSLPAEAAPEPPASLPPRPPELLSTQKPSSDWCFCFFTEPLARGKAHELIFRQSPGVSGSAPKQAWGSRSPGDRRGLAQAESRGL